MGAPRDPAHRKRRETVDTMKDTAPRPAPEDQETPHGCIAGVVYIGRMVPDEETGEETEVIEAVACRRCRG